MLSIQEQFVTIDKETGCEDQFFLHIQHQKCFKPRHQSTKYLPTMKHILRLDTTSQRKNVEMSCTVMFGQTQFALSRVSDRWTSFRGIFCIKPYSLCAMCSNEKKFRLIYSTIFLYRTTTHTVSEFVPTLETNVSLQQSSAF